MEEDALREQVKLMEILLHFSKKNIAEKLLHISYSDFTAWLRGAISYSPKKLRLINCMVKEMFHRELTFEGYSDEELREVSEIIHNQYEDTDFNPRQFTLHLTYL